jgi:hypothetical protein
VQAEKSRKASKSSSIYIDTGVCLLFTRSVQPILLDSTRAQQTTRHGISERRNTGYNWGDGGRETKGLHHLLVLIFDFELEMVLGIRPVSVCPVVRRHNELTS